MRRLFLILAAACVVVPAATASSAGKGNTAAQDIAWFNAQRTANGIPAGITENPEWSADCDQHITFLQKAGGPLRHEEETTSPFYTDAGNWGGTHSVLSQGDSWGADYNPWETAPIHLAQLMDPQLSEMGVADRDGYVCATTWPGMERTPPDTASVVTYPGNNTTTYADESASESPFTPEDIVGITGDTGPNLYVYEWGPVLNDYFAAAAITISSASLTGPEGSVPVKWVDHTTAQIGDYLPEASGIVMPTHPLRYGASYQASVQFSDGTAYTWSFKTRLLDNAASVNGRVGHIIRKRHFPGEVFVTSTDPVAMITATTHGKPVKIRWRGGKGSWFTISPLVQRGLKVCVDSGGGTTGYEPAHACKTF